MGSSDLSQAEIPDAQSSALQLTHPTPGECQVVWKLSSLAWTGALSLPQYLEESAYLTTVPLARDGGMTNWILTDKNLPPDQRPILCSCETFRKRTFLSDRDGNLSERIIHGVASVFCNPVFRLRGYSSRLMRELSQTLRTFQTEDTDCIGSVLYSDIGKKYYADLGWLPFPNNTHIKLNPSVAPKGPRATQILSRDLQQLCEEDEAMIRKDLSRISSNGMIRMMLVPDLDHMLWHHKKEEFVCNKLFGKHPSVKGAIVGEISDRIWAIWTHRFYGDPESATSENTLYILRLVIENQATSSASNAEQHKSRVEQMGAILQAAQDEAAQWNLQRVMMWHPSPLVLNLVEETGIQHHVVEREHEGIASLLWYGDGSGKEDTLKWLGNEKFGWC